MSDFDPIAYSRELKASARAHAAENRRSQRLLALALDLLPHLEAEARERMLAGKADPSPQSDEGRSDANAAELVGVGRSTAPLIWLELLAAIDGTDLARPAWVEEELEEKRKTLSDDLTATFDQLRALPADSLLSVFRNEVARAA